MLIWLAVKGTDIGYLANGTLSCGTAGKEHAQQRANENITCWQSSVGMLATPRTTSWNGLNMAPRHLFAVQFHITKFRKQGGFLNAGWIILLHSLSLSSHGSLHSHGSLSSRVRHKKN